MKERLPYNSNFLQEVKLTFDDGTCVTYAGPVYVKDPEDKDLKVVRIDFFKAREMPEGLTWSRNLNEHISEEQKS